MSIRSLHHKPSSISLNYAVLKQLGLCVTRLKGACTYLQCIWTSHTHSTATYVHPSSTCKTKLVKHVTHPLDLQIMCFVHYSDVFGDCLWRITNLFTLITIINSLHYIRFRWDDLCNWCCLIRNRRLVVFKCKSITNSNRFVFVRGCVCVCVFIVQASDHA